jgi:hypothetical protein
MDSEPGLVASVQAERQLTPSEWILHRYGPSLIVKL